MRFDAQALVAGVTPPVFVDVDGTEYPGRLLSHLETSKFLEMLQGWAKGGLNREQIDQGVRDLCQAAGLPADKILALPEAVYQKWLVDFFGFQMAQINMESLPS